MIVSVQQNTTRIWWCRDMKTFSHYWSLWGNPPSTDGIHSPYKGPVTHSVDVFFVVSLNRLSNKRIVGDLRRHYAQYDVTMMRNVHRRGNLHEEQLPISPIHFCPRHVRNHVSFVSLHLTKRWSPLRDTQVWGSGTRSGQPTAGRNGSDVFNRACRQAAIVGAALLVPSNAIHSFRSSHCNSFEDRAPVDFIYGCPISTWVAESWQMAGYRENNRQQWAPGRLAIFPCSLMTS